MAFFAEIKDSRRFSIEGHEEVFGVYMSCRSHTHYAPIGADENGKVCFVGEPTTFFDDEVTEI